MLKQISKNNYGVYIAVAFVAIFAVVVTVSASVGSIVNNYYGNTTVEQASDGSEPILGAAPSDIASGFYDVYVENELFVDGIIASESGIGLAVFSARPPVPFIVGNSTGQ